MQKKTSFLPKAEELIKIAETQARRERIKDQSEKVQFIAENINEKLEKALKSLPRQDDLTVLELEILDLNLEKDAIKKSSHELSAVVKIIKSISREAVKNIRGKKNINLYIKSFFGRLYSTQKKLNKTIKKYNKLKKQLREIPRIKKDKMTIVLAGMPNVGKTTLLYRLTGSKAKIASYAFTTTNINVGYVKTKYDQIQVIDIPGLLEKKAEKQTKIEQKAKSALKHLDAIVLFIIDPSGSSGNSFEAQKELLGELKKEFREKKFIIVINKEDLAEQAVLDYIKNEFKSGILEGEGRGGKGVLTRLEEELKTFLREKALLQGNQ